MSGSSRRVERAALRLCGAIARMPRLRAVLLSRPVTATGFRIATGCAWFWGAAIGLGRVTGTAGLTVIDLLPAWAFGRGGTTVGGVYLTRDATSPAILRHEVRHVAQWRRYGLAMVPLYLAAGRDPLRNRFEIDAGLSDGGYA